MCLHSLLLLPPKYWNPDDKSFGKKDIATKCRSKQTLFQTRGPEATVEDENARLEWGRSEKGALQPIYGV